jgi:hypothetical protein
MSLNQELTNQLTRFLAGDLSLSEYRQAMMRFRLEKLSSAQSLDKNFVYEFEARYSQLQHELINDHRFKQLLAYAASADSATNVVVQADVWFYTEPTTTLAVTSNTDLSLGNTTRNQQAEAACA